MRVLAITNIYPSVESPASGVFIEQQVQGLLSLGLQVRVMFLDRRRERPRVFYGLGPELRTEIAEFPPHLAPVVYCRGMGGPGPAPGGRPRRLLPSHGT